MNYNSYIVQSNVTSVVLDMIISRTLTPRHHNKSPYNILHVFVVVFLLNRALNINLLSLYLYGFVYVIPK